MGYGGPQGCREWSNRVTGDPQGCRRWSKGIWGTSREVRVGALRYGGPPGCRGWSNSVMRTLRDAGESGGVLGTPRDTRPRARGRRGMRGTPGDTGERAVGAMGTQRDPLHLLPGSLRARLALHHLLPEAEGFAAALLLPLLLQGHARLQLAHLLAPLAVLAVQVLHLPQKETVGGLGAPRTGEKEGGSPIILLTCRRSSCSSRRASRRARSSSRSAARSSVTSRSAAARPSSTSASCCSFSSLTRLRLREGGEGAGVTPPRASPRPRASPQLGIALSITHQGISPAPAAPNGTIPVS